MLWHSIMSTLLFHTDTLLVHSSLYLGICNDIYLPIPLSHSIYLSLYISLSLSIYLSFFISCRKSLSLSFILHISIISLSHSHSCRKSPYVKISLSFSFYLSHSSLSLSLSLSLSARWTRANFSFLMPYSPQQT